MDNENQNNNVIVDGSALSNVYKKTFFLMFLALLATGIISWYTYSSGLFINIVTGGLFEILMIAEILFVVIFSATLNKLSPAVVQILFFVYSVLNGVTLSVIFAVYELTSITIVFFASAILFGIFAFLGGHTKLDLSKIAPFLFGVLIVGIIVSIINIFVGNSTLDIILSWVILIVFFGVTAYDIQKIKALAISGRINLEKLHVYGAFELYLDFINIFLRILSLFGKRK